MRNDTAEQTAEYKGSTVQNYPDFCFPLEINGVESLADCWSSGVLPSLLLNLRNRPGVPDRVNKHWSSKKVVSN